MANMYLAALEHLHHGLPEHALVRVAHGDKLEIVLGEHDEAVVCPPAGVRPLRR